MKDEWVRWAIVVNYLAIGWRLKVIPLDLGQTMVEKVSAWSLYMDCCAPVSDGYNR